MILYFNETAVGKLKAIKISENWVFGKFCAFGEFGVHRNLFAELEAAWTSEVESYFDLQSAVDALQLRIKSESKFLKISDFKIINGNFEAKIIH